MKEIELSNGLIALVDDSDFEWLSQWRWHPAKGKATMYAAHGTPLTRGVCCGTRMHRLIMEAPSDVHVDHINNNGLDNRRSNLRFATPAQNAHNRSVILSSSGFKGVSSNGRRWRAQICAADKRMHLGTYDTPELAARAYDAKARELFGEFAFTNFD
jgi:hypothetical protein